MSAVKVPFETVVPAIVTEPVTELVRPAATLLCPNRISFTRYPTCDPDVTDHVPFTPDAGVEDDELEAVVEGVAFVSVNGAGALAAMKWM
jgi:hypothetical protein